MSNIVPSSGRRMTRQKREDRAYKLALGTGGAVAFTALTLVCAIIGLLSMGVPLLGVLASLGLGAGFYKTTHPAKRR